MRKRIELKSRLKRLEQQQLGNPLKRLIIYGMYDMEDSDVVGMSAGSVDVPRLAQEPLQALQRRAAEVTGAQFLFRVYSTP